jgi:hypothetical protein
MTLGREAYEKYAAHLLQYFQVSIDGWFDLEPHDQHAWNAMAQAMVNKGRNT